MNGIFIDGGVFSLQRYGGISRLHFEILQQMQGQLPFYLFRGFFVDAYPWSDVALEKNTAFPWRMSFPGSIRLQSVANKLWLEQAWAQARKEGFSIYHTSYYRLPRFFGADALIVSDYDCIHERFPDCFPDAKHIKDIKRTSFSAADLIVTISESSKRDIMQFYGVCSDRIRVMPLGVDSFFDMPAREMESNNKERPYLLYVGSRAPYKNYSVLERAFELGLFDDYDLVVVGGSPLFPKIQKVSGTSRVIWREADDEKLRELYWGASALVYPSLYEGFGLPPLEALACGCPAVVAETPVLREVLGDHATYFPAGDVDALQAAVSKAVQQTDSQKIANYIYAKKYSWKKAATKMLGFYHEIMASL